MMSIPRPRLSTTVERPVMSLGVDSRASPLTTREADCRSFDAEPLRPPAARVADSTRCQRPRSAWDLRR